MKSRHLSLLAVPLLLASGCDIKDSASSEYQSQKTNSKNYFESFEEIKDQGDFRTTSFHLGDMDGDGDLDIVLYHSGWDSFNITFLENRIPRKD